MTALDRWFDISARGSTIQAEIRGGAATFFTMAYIVVLNPIILTAAVDVGGEQLDFRAVATSTALVAAVMTILMGVLGRLPLALAAGLGLNGVVAFTPASQMSWADAMGRRRTRRTSSRRRRGRRRDRDPVLPHHDPDAVHVLHHQRHRPGSCPTRC